jgi:polar amino acid transport system substrate-binding protein
MLLATSRRWVCCLFLVALAFSQGMAEAASVQAQLLQESAVEQILQRGALRVGFSTFAPWAMQDKNGKYVGFEIDVAERLAKDMGVKLELAPTQWSGIIPALLVGKFDVLIGGMSITAERSKKVNFSIPYYFSGMSLVADKAKAAGFSSLEDFNKPGVLLVARIGSTAAEAAKKFMPKAELRLFDEEPQAVQELLNGKAHAFISTAPLPATLALKNPDKLFLPLKENFTKEPNGFALRKGDPDSVFFFNSWIVGAQAEGWIQERYHYWFETLDWEKNVQ